MDLHGGAARVGKYIGNALPLKCLDKDVRALARLFRAKVTEGWLRRGRSDWFRGVGEDHVGDA